MAEASINRNDFLKFVFDFYSSMRNSNVILVYQGEITHQITKAFTSLTENYMKKEQEGNSTQKKVFHVMVECLQNISKHADAMSEMNAGIGSFLLTRTDDEYFITTGNVVSNEHVGKMKESLEKINSLSHDELKALYKHQIKEGRISNRGGAGLGFIDIAKKTGNKLGFSFEKINDEYSFFILSSTISR